jgi:hypothetical protein
LVAERDSAPDSPGHELQKSKRALERTQRAQEAVKAAAEDRERAQRLLRLTYETEVLLVGNVARARDRGADQEEIEAREQELEAYRLEATDLEAAWQKAAAEEQQALEEFAAASKELQELTVVPRLEAEKLRFEEHKLRATLSSASIVGIAATSGVLLPDRSSYVVVLGIAFIFCLFVSTVLSLRAMKQTSDYVDGTLISGTVDQPGVFSVG